MGDVTAIQSRYPVGSRVTEPESLPTLVQPCEADSRCQIRTVQALPGNPLMQTVRSEPISINGIQAKGRVALRAKPQNGRQRKFAECAIEPSNVAYLHAWSAQLHAISGSQ